MKLYKAVRPDGTDFRTGTVRWAPADCDPEPGTVVEHPTATSVGDDASEYLSVSTDPTDLPGSSWPMRLLVVEPVGELTTPEPEAMPNKRAAVAFQVVEEIDPSVRFGPQGAEVAAPIRRARRLSPDDASRLSAAGSAAGSAARDAARDAAGSAARDAARDAAGSAAWGAARSAAWSAAGYAAWDAAWDAAWALVVRDLIGSHGFTQEHYDTLTGPWRTVVGPIHPDDAALS